MSDHDDVPALAKQLIENTLLPNIQAGCFSVSDKCELSDEAKELFSRRYFLSIVRRLEMSTTISHDEMLALEAAALCHGKLAGAIWVFRQGKPSPPARVDVEILALGAHIVEFECRELLLALTRHKLGAEWSPKHDETVSRGIFCW